MAASARAPSSNAAQPAAAGASAPPHCVNPGHDQSGPGACPGCTADLTAKYQALSREHLALGDRYNRTLARQSQFERDTKAAAYQRVWTEVLGVHSVIWASGAVRAAEGSIGPLLYQAGELLTEDAGRTREHRRIIALIKQSAVLAGRELTAARPDPAADPLRAEIRRVRGYVTAAGRRLHTAHGGPALPCRCPGCELIRGMDDIPDPGGPTAAAAATGDEEPARLQHWDGGVSQDCRTVHSALLQADAAGDAAALAVIAWRLFAALGIAQADASRRAMLLRNLTAGPAPAPLTGNGGRPGHKPPSTDRGALLPPDQEVSP